jgi:hypothetical protein
MSIVDDIPAPAPCCPVVDNRVGGGYNESVLLAKGDEGDVVPDSLLCLFRNEEANDVSAALLFPFPKAFPYPLDYYHSRLTAHTNPLAVPPLYSSPTKRACRRTSRRLLRDSYRRTSMRLRYKVPAAIARCRWYSCFDKRMSRKGLVGEVGRESSSRFHFRCRCRLHYCLLSVSDV